MSDEKKLQKIFISNDISNDLSDFLHELKPQKIFILTDTNTSENCFSVISDILPSSYHHYTITAGEEYKNIETLQKIWDFLSENKADKNSLLINLGGGTVTDIGGFAASTYKRGMDFVNIPTSLLAQVDASVGGKNGINYHNIKNIIGTINFPLKTYVAPQFLKTLPDNEFLSGLAEMLKHGLIADSRHFDEICEINPVEKKENIFAFLPLIERSIEIKSKITEADPFEKGIRKALNFGHTFGHAFEQFFMDTGKPLKHGFAVAYGIICELYVSHKKSGFDLMQMLKIIEKIYSIYGRIDFSLENIPDFIATMHHDKKNSDSQINCTCLSKIGKYEIDIRISEETAKEALIFYKQMNS